MDPAYQNAPHVVPRLLHHYGERVHLVHDPVSLHRLARLSAPDCVLPEMLPLTRTLYAQLLHQVLLAAWPRTQLSLPTRMAAAEGQRGHWAGQTVTAPARQVVVDIARAGTLPAQVCFETLLELFGAKSVRQDHLSMSRVAGASGPVSDAEVHASKVGGAADGAWLLLPDPMGATGTSMAKAIDLYKKMPPGPPARIFALHLIVTPEYLAHMHSAHPDVDVWALRLDRGRSAEDVLASPPGSRWREERGLNEHAYIVPGAGGIGELLNNAER